MPKVTIIIPAYNAEKFIGRCVKSVLRQEYEDFELIVIDDASTDRTAALLEGFAEEDSRVRVIAGKVNRGVSACRNAGLEAAQGEYIQFIDADDWITPDATRLMVTAAEDSGGDLVVSDFYRVVDKNVAVKGDIDQGGLLSREDFADCMMENPADFYYGVLWNKLFRRDLIRKYDIRMDESLSWCEDFIFNLEYILHCSNIMILKSPVYYYVKTKGSLASSPAFSDFVRMKLNVLEYYDQFYRQVYDEEEYKRRKPDIYRFLIDSAGDGNAFAIMPATKKLGEEKGSVALDSNIKDSPLLDLYLARKMMDRCLSYAAERCKLDVRDVRAFVYISSAGSSYTFRGLMDFTGMTTMTAAASVQKLQSRNFIDITYESGTPVITLMREGSTLADAVSESFENYQKTLTRHLKKEEKELYYETGKAIRTRLRRLLRPQKSEKKKEK